MVQMNAGAAQRQIVAQRRQGHFGRYAEDSVKTCNLRHYHIFPLYYTYLVNRKYAKFESFREKQCFFKQCLFWWTTAQKLRFYVFT